MVAFVDSIMVFVVGLLLGALGIYVGAPVWAIVSFLVGGIPFLGPVPAFVAYLGVIEWRYSGDRGDALSITLVAWVVVAAVLYALTVANLASPDAVGVPFA